MSGKYFNISKKAQDSAEAATSFDLVEPEPGGQVPVRVTNSNDGREFRRWTEPARIVKATAEDKKYEAKGDKPARSVRSFYVALQAKPTSILNKGRWIHARHEIDPIALANGEESNGNNRAIKALKTLFEAVGIKLPNGEITAQILEAAFPEKGLSTMSILSGKEAQVMVASSPRQDGKGKNFNVDEYLPAKQG